MRRYNVFSIFLTTIAILANLAAAAQNVPIVLFDGLLIDGKGSDPIAHAVLIIEGNRIKSIGTTQTISLPAKAKILRLKGRTIMPGVINAHVHRGYDKTILKAWARGGVTTVRDLAYSTLGVEWFKIRDKLLKGTKNARLVAVGPMITTPGGYPIEPWKIEAITVISKSDATEETEKLLSQGADLIKIAVENGRYFRRKIPVLPTEIAASIAATAHRHGTKVSAHVTAPEDLPAVIEAGVDDIAHMVLGDLSDEVIRSIIQKDIYWVPTLELWHVVQKHLNSTGVNFKPYDQAVINLSKFVKQGGKVALGTDYDGYRVGLFELGMPMIEIHSMKKAGMSPMQIIVAATKHAAHVCNLSEKLGTLEKNKIADIIVINGNPLDNLKHMKNVSVVIRNGIIIRNSLSKKYFSQ